MELIELVMEYYDKRGLKYPTNVWQALAFSQTEFAEVYEILLDRDGGWVRNNPQDKPKFSKEDLAEELGDAIMMLLVAGLVEKVDPLSALENKINRKLGKSESSVPYEIKDIVTGTRTGTWKENGTIEWK